MQIKPGIEFGYEIDLTIGKMEEIRDRFGAERKRLKGQPK